MRIIFVPGSPGCRCPLIAVNLSLTPDLQGRHLSESQACFSLAVQSRSCLESSYEELSQGPVVTNNAGFQLMFSGSKSIACLLWEMQIT